MDDNNNIKLSRPVPPFLRYCSAIIPTAFDDSLSYYEALCALYKWLQTNVIDTINHNASVTNDFINKEKELEELFEQLKEYVDTYFENLDVQEEINNKLDEMAEQGQLADIISQYLNSTAVFGYDTVADMKNADNLVNGSYARTLGYHTKNDGGGALYKIRKITNDDVIDESFIIEMGDPSDELIAEYVVSGDIYVEQLGAANLVDSTAKIQHLIDYSIANDLCLKFSNKEYNITSIDFKTAKLIFEKTTFQVIASEEDVAIKVTSPYKGSKYSDFTLKGIGKTGIKVTSAKNITFERVVVEDCKTGFEAYSGYEISLLDSLFVNSSDIVDSVGIIVSTWDSVYSDIVIQGYRTGVKTTVNTIGVYYDKIHIWSTDANTVKNSVGMDMNGGGEVHNCTFDTCLIGVKLHRKEKLYLLNCRWFWNTMWFTDAILDGATPYLIYFDDATCSNWFEMHQCYGYKPNSITTLNFTNISESDWQGLCNIKAHNRDLYIGGFDGYLPLGQKASLNTPDTLTDVFNVVRYNNDSFSLYYVGKIASDAAEGQIDLGYINKNIAMTDLPVNTVCTYGNQWNATDEGFAYLYINENGLVQTRITPNMRDKYLKIYISYSK